MSSIPVTSSANVATDLVGDVHYQEIKLIDGTTGSGTAVSAHATRGLKVDPLVLVTADADLTQLITVTTAGTPVQGPAKTNPGGWMVKSDPDNTGSVWFMYHGQTKALKGFPLGVGESMVVPVESLAALDFDADTSGDKVHATKL